MEEDLLSSAASSRTGSTSSMDLISNQQPPDGHTPPSEVKGQHPTHRRGSGGEMYQLRHSLRAVRVLEGQNAILEGQEGGGGGGGGACPPPHATATAVANDNHEGEKETGRTGQTGMPQDSETGQTRMPQDIGLPEKETSSQTRMPQDSETGQTRNSQENIHRMHAVPVENQNGTVCPTELDQECQNGNGDGACSEAAHGQGPAVAGGGGMSSQLDGNSNGAVAQENRNGTASATQYGNGTCEDSRVPEDIRLPPNRHDTNTTTSTNQLATTAQSDCHNSNNVEPDCIINAVVDL